MFISIECSLIAPPPPPPPPPLHDGKRVGDARRVRRWGKCVGCRRRLCAVACADVRTRRAATRAQTCRVQNSRQVTRLQPTPRNGPTALPRCRQLWRQRKKRRSASEGKSRARRHHPAGAPLAQKWLHRWQVAQSQSAVRKVAHVCACRSRSRTSRSRAACAAVVAWSCSCVAQLAKSACKNCIIVKLTCHVLLHANCAGFTQCNAVQAPVPDGGQGARLCH